MGALDEAQTAQLLVAAKGTPWHVPVLLAVATGLRRGEVLGLRWQDVDLEAGRLTVQQTLEETRSGLAFKPPKTAKSRRCVPIPGVRRGGTSTASHGPGEGQVVARS
jgi:integrase